MAGLNIWPGEASDKGDAEWILRAIIENSDVAVICADEAGIIRLWNAGAEEIFGWTKHEALGIFLRTQRSPVQHLLEAERRGTITLI
jgi:PAS domain S-box-containing protein